MNDIVQKKLATIREIDDQREQILNKPSKTIIDHAILKALDNKKRQVLAQSEKSFPKGGQ